MTSIDYLDRSFEPRVVCAAIRNAEGTRIIAGPRHYDSVMIEQIYASEGPLSWKAAEQGFIDQRGNFLTREEALTIALKNDQRIFRCGGDETELYSENLY